MITLNLHLDETRPAFKDKKEITHLVGDMTIASQGHGIRKAERGSWVLVTRWQVCGGRNQLAITHNRRESFNSEARRGV